MLTNKEQEFGPQLILICNANSPSVEPNHMKRQKGYMICNFKQS